MIYLTPNYYSRWFKLNWSFLGLEEKGVSGRLAGHLFGLHVAFLVVVEPIWLMLSRVQNHVKNLLAAGGRKIIKDQRSLASPAPQGHKGPGLPSGWTQGQPPGVLGQDPLGHGLGWKVGHEDVMSCFGKDHKPMEMVYLYVMYIVYVCKFVLSIHIHIYRERDLDNIYIYIYVDYF